MPCAGLVPAAALADRIGLRDLAEEWLTVPGSQGTAGAKVMSLVAVMLAGADSVDDMDLLRYGGMDKVTLTHPINHADQPRTPQPPADWEPVNWDLPTDHLAGVLMTIRLHR